MVGMRVALQPRRGGGGAVEPLAEGNIQGGGWGKGVFKWAKLGGWSAALIVWLAPSFHV